MPRAKNKISIQTVNSDALRHRYDEKTNQWYFSIVDIIAVVTNSKDPRNYWKVLKNRLKKEQNELVTKFNQLKMLSKDGKYYLTDSADTETILKMLEIISPDNITPFKAYFEDFLSCNSDDPDKVDSSEEAELLVDASETATEIVVRAMVAGVSLGDLFIRPAKNQITIRGRRLAPKNISEGDYFFRELLWSRFARVLSLPSPVDADTAETTEKNGLLIIRLKKII